MEGLQRTRKNKPHLCPRPFRLVFVVLVVIVVRLFLIFFRLDFSPTPCASTSSSGRPSPLLGRGALAFEIRVVGILVFGQILLLLLFLFFLLLNPILFDVRSLISAVSGIVESRSGRDIGRQISDSCRREDCGFKSPGQRKL